jgi:hypothetical protein
LLARGTTFGRFSSRSAVEDAEHGTTCRRFCSPRTLKRSSWQSWSSLTPKFRVDGPLVNLIRLGSVLSEQTVSHRRSSVAEHVSMGSPHRTLKAPIRLRFCDSGGSGMSSHVSHALLLWTASPDRTGVEQRAACHGHNSRRCTPPAHIFHDRPTYLSIPRTGSSPLRRITNSPRRVLAIATHAPSINGPSHSLIAASTTAPWRPSHVRSLPCGVRRGLITQRVLQRSQVNR